MEKILGSNETVSFPYEQDYNCSVSLDSGNEKQGKVFNCQQLNMQLTQAPHCYLARNGTINVKCEVRTSIYVFTDHESIRNAPHFPQASGATTIRTSFSLQNVSLVFVAVNRSLFIDHLEAPTHPPGSPSNAQSLLHAALQARFNNVALRVAEKFERDFLLWQETFWQNPVKSLYNEIFRKKFGGCLNVTRTQSDSIGSILWTVFQGITIALNWLK